MRPFPFVLGLLAAGLLFSGCTESEEAPKPEPPPLPPAEFTRSEDPKAFFEDYLEDLRGQRFLPEEMVALLTGQTDLADAGKMVSRHQTLDFVEWYYADDYLNSVRDAVETKLDRLDYQLEMLDVAREDAAPVLMIVHSGVLEQKQILEGEDFKQEWAEGQDSFRIRLSGDGQETYLLLFREQGEWNLGILAKAAPVSEDE